jgi:hypothetical protein
LADTRATSGRCGRTRRRVHRFKFNLVPVITVMCPHEYLIKGKGDRRCSCTAHPPIRPCKAGYPDGLTRAADAHICAVFVFGWVIRFSLHIVASAAAKCDAGGRAVAACCIGAARGGIARFLDARRASKRWRGRRERRGGECCVHVALERARGICASLRAPPPRMMALRLVALRMPVDAARYMAGVTLEHTELSPDPACVYAASRTIIRVRVPSQLRLRGRGRSDRQGRSPNKLANGLWHAQ